MTRVLLSAAGQAGGWYRSGVVTVGQTRKE